MKLIDAIRLLALIVPTSLVPSSHAAVTPLLEKVDLFEAGQGGYVLYRIPGVVVTTRGTVLAYAEARQSGRGDWSAIDLVLRRSTNGGRTWGPPRQMADVPGPKFKNPVALAQKLAATNEVTYNNPVALLDGQTATVHFLFCLEYARCFHRASDDDGQGFTPPLDITPTFDRFRPEYDWKVLATGPGHGIQLKNGRLLVPVWLSTGAGGHAHRPSIVSTIFSDDHGRTWQRGEIAAAPSAELINPNESVAVQLADGRVMLNMRSESKANRRAVIYSPDGATQWTKPVFHEQLLEPICMASLIRFPERSRPDRNGLIFANPHNLERTDGKTTPGLARDRKNLTIKLSRDEGQSWSVSKTLEAGASAYSDLAVLPDGVILCYYERGRPGAEGLRAGSLTLARFNLEWLEPGEGR